jgi:glycosyltransferase involved in cell wall biosynthesis
MIVPNLVLNDNRVIKSAGTLARAGMQVTVIGLKLGGEEEFIEQDGWDLRIVPFSNSAQLAANERARSSAGDDHHRAAPRVDPRAEADIHRELKNERMLIENRRREAAAEVGWAREDARKRRLQWVSNLQTRKESAVEKLAARTRRLKAAARKAPRPVGRVVLTGSEFIRLPYRVARAAQRWSARRPAPNSRKDEQRIRRQLQSDEDKYAEHRQLLLDELAVVQDQTTSAIREEHPWREYLPILHNYESALGPVLDSLDVDVIHVQDFPLLGVGARAAGRAIRKGKAMRLIYDAHEYVAGIRYADPIKGRAWLSLEREYLHHADQVITVSEPIAERIQSDYALSRKPTVVLNAPVHTDRTGRAPDLRKLAGVPAEARVIVYSGNLQPERNLTTVVQALPLMDEDVHFVVVGNEVTAHVETFLRLARHLGVADRVHLVPYVEGNLVPEYLSSADLAVHPMTTDSLNHQLALPNKIFEYLHAGLPELVSDNAVMASFVAEHAIGESFSARDPADLAHKATLMLDDSGRYRRTIESRPDLAERYSWQSQIPSLLSAYEELLDIRLAVSPASSGRGEDTLPATSRSVLFLPTNTAGQAWAWAKALEAHYEGVTTEVIERERESPFRFASDRRFLAKESASPGFMLEEMSNLLGKTHAIIEGGHSMFGSLPERSFWDDLGLYEGARVLVALVFHGSDIRDPDKHAAEMEYSPYKADSLYRIDSELILKIRAIVQRLSYEIRKFDGPVFVSTPDLMDYLPRARWLPQVVDLKFWDPAPIRIGERRPRVVMVPSSNVLKGSAYADAVCWQLHEAGLINYQPLRSVSPRQMGKAITRADIVIDGLVLGAYGTTAVEGMATQRLVISNVERVVDRVEQLPIVNADPGTLESTLLDITENPDRFRLLAEQGRAYVERYHDGSYSVIQLAAFLGLESSGVPSPGAP